MKKRALSGLPRDCAIAVTLMLAGEKGARHVLQAAQSRAVAVSARRSRRTACHKGLLTSKSGGGFNGNLAELEQDGGSQKGQHGVCGSGDAEP